MQPASVNTDAGIYGLYGTRGGETKEHFRDVGPRDRGIRKTSPAAGRWVMRVMPDL
jgi:hypothetical protein